MPPAEFDILALLAPIAVTIGLVIVGAIGLGLTTGYLPKLAAQIGVKVFSMFVKK